ncbi:MAG: glycosyltransferase [Leptolyngbyaceae cyanobacterium SM1_3_5]|nr:glycosyltransferase [Leptolyngbyaceae cyanobacterium SM1_3_5]
MLISVIIPTYQREAVLCGTIASLLEQDDSAYEVLIIDQQPRHEAQTQRYLEELAAIEKIRWYQVGWASLPGARNFGIRRSRGEIVLFLDDDVILPAGFLAAHRRNYDRAEVGAVAGRVFDRQKLAEAEFEIQDLPLEAIDPAIGWYSVDLVHTVKAQPVLTARGCNMSFRREVFTKFGLRFDERFGGSAVREESDICLQLRQTNLQIWYDPIAHLIHLGEETGGCHELDTRSPRYQITFYHNHFWLGIKNLTVIQCARFFAKLFDCHVLGRPPCNKSRSPFKTIVRAGFYLIGFAIALQTKVRSIWDDGQIYSRQDQAADANFSRQPHLHY